MADLQAIEWSLPWGPVLRGLRWGGGPDLALLLHDPGRDLDAWAMLPGEITGQLGIETVAVDLPGHGLSDDPWEPKRLTHVLRSVPEMAPAARRRFLIAAGDSSVAALDQARDRKSTRLNSSHANISYAVFCLKKK